MQNNLVNLNVLFFPPRQAENKYRKETITKLFDLSSSLNKKEPLVNANVGEIRSSAGNGEEIIA